MIGKDIKMMDISNDEYLQRYVYTHQPMYMYGKMMHDTIVNSFSDIDKWFFPNGVKEKIEDDELYLVWYEWIDSADMRNESTKYYVKYIEIVPEYIKNSIWTKEFLEKEIDKYTNDRRNFKYE